VQALVEVHDTPLRLAYAAPVGVGVDWIDQLVPSQRSTNGPFPMWPTAVHAVAEVHDTPFSMAPPVGLGVDWIVQRVPSHRSAKVSSSPPRLNKEPMAVQAEAEVHDTPVRTLSTGLVGLRVDWIDQLVPSQPWAKVREFGAGTLLFTMSPTAVQAVVEVHDTALSPMRGPP
jgi:hypothetical protein